MPDDSTPAPTCARCKLRYVLEVCGSGPRGIYIPAKSRRCQDPECPNKPPEGKNR